MLIPTKILVPTDFSEHSDRAFGQALDIAKDYSSKVFFSMLSMRSSTCYVRFTKRNSTVNRRMQSFGQGKFSRAVSGGFPKAKGVEVETNVRKGVPSEEILKEGKEKGIDLIVIALTRKVWALQNTLLVALLATY